MEANVMQRDYNYTQKNSYVHRRQAAKIFPLLYAQRRRKLLFWTWTISIFAAVVIGAEIFLR
jgi:hypothetical protein